MTKATTNQMPRSLHVPARWLVGTALLGALVMAQAAGSGEYKTMDGPGMSGPPTPEKMADRIASVTNANAEQKAQLQDIAQSAAKDLEPLFQQIQDKRAQGAQLAAAQDLDMGAIQELQQEEMALHQQILQVRNEAMLKTLQVLTPEQRAKWVQAMQSKGQQRGMNPKRNSY